jgi:LytTr DNA-binding domain-containing protein
MASGALGQVRRAPIVIAAVWGLVALVAAMQTVWLVRLDGHVELTRAIASRLSIIPLWALATPAILRSARRYPVVARGWELSARHLALHVALGSGFVVVSNVLIRIPTLVRGGWDALVHSTSLGVAEFYPMAMVVYLAIVAIGHAIGRASGAAVDDAAASSADPSTMTSVALEAPVAIAAVAAPADVVPGAAAPAPNEADCLTVRQWNRVHLVRLDDIDFIEAEDNYVVVHAAGRTYKGRERISDVEARLDQRRFVRIHRSTIVQVGKIREVQPLSHGDHAVILRSGTVLRAARSRRQALEERLGV